MIIKNAKFLTTVVNGKDILKFANNEFAFVGRSNAGKSSLINALCNNKGLAKTSQTPGKTKNINYFEINNGAFTFVDLPGYGFHKAGKAEDDKWDTLMDDYFKNSKNLKCVYILMDIRVLPNNLDKQMVKYLAFYNIPFYIVATKADKISKQQANNLAQKIAHELCLTKTDVLITSSSAKTGLTELAQTFDRFL